MNYYQKNFYAVLLFAITALLSSCKKNSVSSPLPAAEPTMAVEKIQAAVGNNIRLEPRENTRVILRNVEYNYSFVNSQLVATPAKSPYQLPFKRDMNGNIQAISGQQALVIQLVAQGYLFQNNQLKDPPPPKPLIKDQENLEDLINADMLIGEFTGLPSNNLSGISLTHANNLFDFEIRDIPADKIASVKLIIRNEQFRPVRLANNRYRAVITGNWYTPADIYVLINTVDKLFNLKLLNGQDIKQDLHYNLIVKANQDNGGFTVTNNGETKWSDEIWPQ